MTTEALTAITRPIVSIENRTSQEVFDIMCDRVRLSQSQTVGTPAPETHVDAQISDLEKQIKDLKHDLASAEGRAKNATSNCDYWRGQYETLAANPSPQTNLPVNARIAFGLEAQGHIPAVEAALAEGADWQEIGRRIGWDGETAKAYYERHLARLATTEGQP